MSDRTRTAASTKTIRTSTSGRFLGVRIVDPAVRPKGVTVAKIRAAIREATAALEKRRTTE